MTTATYRSDGLLAQCSRFIYEEAELLDSMKLEAWLDIFDETAIYWLPIDSTKTSPVDTLNLIYDDRLRLVDRVSRLRSGHAFSEVPESRTSHMIANLRLLEETEFAASVHSEGLVEEEIAVAGRGTVARLRLGTCRLFHLRTAWVLRPDGDSFKIRMKRIDLLDAQEPLPLLTFLL
jgi:benzoate/toluate 1,2-dioxygenase subunit beta